MRQFLAWLHRRRRWITYPILIFVVAPLLLLHLAVAPYIGGKLENQLRNRLHTDLTVGYFLYTFPYGLTAHNVHMQLPSYAGGHTLDVESIRITLDRLPWGPGPIVISDLSIVQPTIQWKTGQSTSRPSTNPEPANFTPPKVSDFLRLHHLSVRNGQVIVNNADLGVMAWGGIDVDIDASRRGEADYDFKLNAVNGQAAEFAALGSLNVDNRTGKLANFALAARSDDHAPAQIPPQFQEIWREYRVRGTLRVDGDASFDVIHPNKNTFSAKLALQDATGYWPQLDATLDDLSLQFTTSLQNGKMTGQVTQFAARSGSANLSVNNGVEMALDLQSRAWSVGKVCGKVAFDNGATRPSDQSRPIFGSAQLWGQLVFWGHVNSAPDPDQTPDYQLLFTCDHASYYLPHPRLELSQISISGHCSGDQLHVEHFQCQGFGGTVAARGDFGLSSPYPYAFNIDAREANLLQVSAFLDPDSSGGHLQGLLHLQAQFSGKISDNGSSVDLLKGRGRFAISQGNLWDTPTLQQIEKRLSIARKALTVGHAAARFTVVKRRVGLTDAVVSAPVLGLQGSGSVDFDGKLDFHLIAVPLESWKQALTKANIPIVGKLLSETAGKVQDILNSATSSLLYEFHVTGTSSKPKLETIPAPVISRNALDIFNKMLNPQPENEPTEMPPDITSDSSSGSND